MIAMIRLCNIYIYTLFWFSNFPFCHNLHKSDRYGFIRISNILNNFNTNRYEGRRKNELFSKIEIKMPALSSTMTSGKIIKWNKEIGDYINPGDIIMTVESDKADMDVEAFDEGYLRKKNLQNGEDATVGDILGIMTTEENEPLEEETITTTANATANATVSDTNTDLITSRDVFSNLHTNSRERKMTTEGDNSTKYVEETKTDINDIKINMPHITNKNKKAKIAKWLKKEHDYIHENEILFYVEDDMNKFEVKSEHEGILKQILVKEGDFADLGITVATISKKRREEIDKEQKYTQFKEIKERERINEENILHHYQDVLNESPEGKAFLNNLTDQEKKILEERLKLNFEKYSHASIHNFAQIDKNIENLYQQRRDIKEEKEEEKKYRIILPSALELLKQHKLNPENITETKIPNRITYEDVDNFIKKKNRNKETEIRNTINENTPVEKEKHVISNDMCEENRKTIELSNIQKTIKNNMMLTLNVPVFRVTHLIKTNELMKLYQQIKDKISMTVILNKCIAIVLEKHPIIYSTYVEEGNGKIVFNEDINIGNALGLDDSLLTPVLKKINKQNIYALSDMWKELVKKGRSGTLTASEMSGSNFYVSNLGMFNTYQFDAILPKGCSCILSVGTNISNIENYDELKIKKGMMMTLTCDHRHIYGSHAAAFMNDLSQFIENDIMKIFL